MPVAVDWHGMGASSHRFSEGVVQAVAAAKGVDPMQLQPLYDVVDLDALDALFQRTADGAPATTGSVRFEYAGKTVVVHSDGSVHVGDTHLNGPETATAAERDPGADQVDSERE